MPVGRGRPRKLTRAQIALLRRTPRKRERFIAGYEFPFHLSARVRKRFPMVRESDWPLVELGLQEWLVCCAWRGAAVLGMPSRAVDEAWHEFILDSIAYTAFCEKAFGEYLHHTPDEAMSTPMGNALGATVQAWDRSEAGREWESVLWDLDQRLGIDDPLGIDEQQLVGVRAAVVGYPFATAPCFVGGGGCGGGGNGGESGGGGCGGGGGCSGGGGCGGGGGGGS
jgi:uncharacterized membrane protein YgcG